MTQRACCFDIPRPSAKPSHASHLPPSHDAPFGMASVCCTDLSTKDYLMFKQGLGYFTIFHNPMVNVWAKALSWQWSGDYPLQDATVLMTHMMREINTPCGTSTHIWLALILWPISDKKMIISPRLFCTKKQTPMAPLSLISMSRFLMADQQLCLEKQPVTCEQAHNQRHMITKENLKL